jgi:hypothetical protein
MATVQAADNKRQRFECIIGSLVGSMVRIMFRAALASTGRNRPERSLS